jgi:hypothetical protein
MDRAVASTARTARINLLESMLTASSTTLVAMSIQLSEAEERERTCSGRARWQKLRSMGDAKTLLHLTFNVASLSRSVNIIQPNNFICVLLMLVLKHRPVFRSVNVVM